MQGWHRDAIRYHLGNISLIGVADRLTHDPPPTKEPIINLLPKSLPLVHSRNPYAIKSARSFSESGIFNMTSISPSQLLNENQVSQRFPCCLICIFSRRFKIPLALSLNKRVYNLVMHSHNRKPTSQVQLIPPLVRMNLLQPHNPPVMQLNGLWFQSLCSPDFSHTS